jgi:FkbM family methyltransferase
MLRRTVQTLIIWTLRPYILHELPGWGKLMNAVASYRRDWLWARAPVKLVRGKLHGLRMHLDLAQWPDRWTYFLGRWYDLGTQSLMLSFIQSGGVVIDVGANRGMFALTASGLVGDKGQVICFEPNPTCVSLLQREIAFNGIKNIVIHQFALGNRTDELILSIPVYNSGQGTFSCTLYAKEMTHKVRSQVKIGDELLTLGQLSFLKIDVEGFEADVVKGLFKTIQQHRPIIVTEINHRHLESCGSSFKELKALMNELSYIGYKLAIRKTNGRYDWHLTSIDGDSQDYDAVWLHSTAFIVHARILHGRID